MIRTYIFDMFLTFHVSMIVNRRFEFPSTNITKQDGLVVLVLQFMTFRIYMIIERFGLFRGNLTKVAISIFPDPCPLSLRIIIFVK